MFFSQQVTRWPKKLLWAAKVLPLEACVFWNFLNWKRCGVISKKLGMMKRCKVDSWQTHEDWDWVNASALLSMKSVPKKGHRRDIRGDPLSYIFFAGDCNIKKAKSSTLPCPVNMSFSAEVFEQLWGIGFDPSCHPLVWLDWTHRYCTLHNLNWLLRGTPKVIFWGVARSNTVSELTIE